MNYAYVRVSSKDQREDRQLVALGELPIERRNIYIDKCSGRDFDRPAYRRLLKRLKPGDILYIHSIDRLGRDYDEILEQWRTLTKERRVDVVVLDMPLLDTRQKNDLTGALIADIVLQLLSYVAQRERELIHSRQAEGIAAAKSRGVVFGAAPKPKPEFYEDYLALWLEGRISMSEFARKCRVSRTTLYKWLSVQKSTPC